jgi:AcrR family transcriptional regulator
MSDLPTALRDFDTRKLIVSTAERLFRTLGYQKTTVGDIAKELDMSPANVYRFFDSKAALRDAVGRHLMSEVEDAVASERLRAAMLAMCMMNQERYLSDHKMHEMIAVALDESWGMVLHHIDIIEKYITKICTDGIASGEFKVTDPLLAARSVKSAMISYCHPQLLEECAGIPGPTAEQMMDFCLAALKKG